MITMKILHTSDWHLGQRFINRERGEEHQRALRWLLEVLREQAVDALLIAGDLFDTGNPPNYALREYYRFLTQVRETGCQHLLVIGGNHDSPATLNAPQALLEALDIRVFGCAPRNAHGEIDYAAELLPLHDTAGNLQAVLAAVPFLRDRDLKYAQAGETAAEREAAVKQGIAEHYAKLAEQLQKNYAHTVPFIATGHLFAAGAALSDSEKIIHVGNLGQISAAQFPAVFDYVALGHLHQPQQVGGCEHIRYSGSLLPLSFKESQHSKQVLLVEFSGSQLSKITPLAVPVSRPLLRLQGDLDSLEAQLKALKPAGELPTWVEIELDRAYPEAASSLQAVLKNKPVEILKMIVKRDKKALDFSDFVEDLEDLTPLDVFQRRCQLAQKNAQETQSLQEHFRILLENIDTV